MKKTFRIVSILTVLVLMEFIYAQERFRREAPPPDPLPELTLPQVERHTLTNGLELTVARTEKAPIMQLRMIVNNGEGSSPSDLPGLATFTAKILNKGAGNLTASDIEEYIESIGGSFSADVFPNYSQFSFSFLEVHLDDALDILSRMILQPVFSKLEVDNVKRSMYYDHIQRYVHPEALGKKILYQILFQNHPFQRIAFNEDVIKNFSREALLAFFEDHYLPNNSRILLIGNINLQTASRKISHYFKDWQSKEMETASIPPPSPNESLKICFVDFPQQKNVTLFLGNILPLENQNSRFSYLVFNQVLGGTTNSRLLINLRESKRYAFWAFSEIEFFENFGMFYVRSMIQPDALYNSVEEIIQEIRKAIHSRLPISDIEQAKSYLIGHFPLTIQSADDFASKISELEAYNLGEELWNRYYENISLVNPGDVFESLSNTSLLQPVVIIVGDRNRLTDQLNSFDEVEFYDKNGNLQFSIKGENE